MILYNFDPKFHQLKYGVIYVILPTHLYAMSNKSSDILLLLRRHTNFHVEFIHDDQAQEVTILARRFNLGNMGRDAIVKTSFPSDFNNNYLDDIKSFIDILTDITSTSSGDITLETQRTHQDLESIPPAMPSSHSHFNYCKKSILLDFCEESEAAYACGDEDEDEDEENEVEDIECQRQNDLKAIQAQILDYVTKYHADPSQLMVTLLEGKFVIGNNRLSPIVVNNDLKIVLPGYNEVEVKMPAMCRTVYILFLNHPEGIELRNISNYRQEIRNIYSMVKPGRNEDLARKSIDMIMDPLGNTLNETISKIKRCIASCIISNDIAAKYYITGERGGAYRIALAPSLITLPRAVTQ